MVIICDNCRKERARHYITTIESQDGKIKRKELYGDYCDECFKKIGLVVKK